MNRRSRAVMFLAVGLFVLAPAPFTPEASAGGGPFPPITTQKLTITGKGTESGFHPLPFTPVTFTTAKLTITGKGTESGFHPLPFTPVVITTQKLTITGKK
jgi:hypothetical protein